MAAKEFTQIRKAHSGSVDINIDTYGTTCDVCGEKSDSVLTFDVMVKDGATISYFDICRPCLLRALIEMDDLEKFTKRLK